MNESDLPVYPILLAGGTGTRLWPVSRELYPKQLVKFIGRDSFVQSTIKRLTPLLDLQNVRVVCGQKHYHEIARHMADIGVAGEGKIIQEPSGRNTAPAILLAAFHLRRKAPDAILCIFPADHVIADIKACRKRTHRHLWHQAALSRNRIWIH
jgi:mannose-1-phosphate guanylyltransferase/mannose-6-phosphate isomerase